MKVLGIRFCCVSDEAEAIARTLDGLGLGRMEIEGAGEERFGGFPGAIFPAADGSWVEVWASGVGMPAGTMLQVVVDDADAFAEHARANGLDPQGPADAHGERIYFLPAPGGLQMTFQSRLPDSTLGAP
jgi:hypothetical protein